MATTTTTTTTPFYKSEGEYGYHMGTLKFYDRDAKKGGFGIIVEVGTEKEYYVSFRDFLEEDPSIRVYLCDGEGVHFDLNVTEDEDGNPVQTVTNLTGLFGRPLMYQLARARYLRKQQIRQEKQAEREAKDVFVDEEGNVWRRERQPRQREDRDRNEMPRQRQPQKRREENLPPKTLPPRRK